MRIETKYNVLDKLFFLSNNKVLQAKVSHIEIRVRPLSPYATKTEIIYHMSNNMIFAQHDVFSTKEELLLSL